MERVQHERYQQAIEHLQYLPTRQQQVVFDLIDDLFEMMADTSANTPQAIGQHAWQTWLKDNHAFAVSMGLSADTQLSTQQKSFLMWRADYEKRLACDDEWTDEQYDEFWASLRDKNDTGREVIFE